MTKEIRIELKDQYSMNSKRIYANVWFELKCPSCGVHSKTVQKGDVFFYCPDEYPYFNFHCHECETDHRMFDLKGLENQVGENSFAIVVKCEGIGDVDIMKMEPIKQSTV